MNETSASNFLRENNAKHYWHPMTDPKRSAEDPPLIITKGDGEYIWDVDGNKCLDVTGGLWLFFGQAFPQLVTNLPSCISLA